jgi:hypothetical protein
MLGNFLRGVTYSTHNGTALNSLFMYFGQKIELSGFAIVGRKKTSERFHTNFIIIFLSFFSSVFCYTIGIVLGGAIIRDVKMTKILSRLFDSFSRKIFDYSTGFPFGYSKVFLQYILHKNVVPLNIIHQIRKIQALSTHINFTCITGAI